MEVFLKFLWEQADGLFGVAFTVLMLISAIGGAGWSTVVLIFLAAQSCFMMQMLREGKRNGSI